MNEQVTCSDIIAEMREGLIPRHRHDRELLHYYADRLEAARKRESGDCAKLRKVLKLCIDEMCNRCLAIAAERGNPLSCLNGCDPVRRAKATLAATEESEVQ